MLIHPVLIEGQLVGFATSNKGRADLVYLYMPAVDPHLAKIKAAEGLLNGTLVFTVGGGEPSRFLSWASSVSQGDMSVLHDVTWGPAR